MNEWNDEHQMVWEHTNMGLNHLKMIGAINERERNKIINIIQRGIERHLGIEE